MNKKDLIKKGYSFEKIGKDHYLVIPEKRKRTVEELELDFKTALEMRNIFLKGSTERRKALSIILPLINKADMIDLFSELYDLRKEGEICENIHKDIKKVLNKPDFHKQLNLFIDSKCRPKRVTKKKSIKMG